MFQSMTGFGSASGTFKGSRGTLELSADIRTVNSKYLDVKIKSPRAYASFDLEVTKLIRSRFKRGRVDVNITLRV